jgi:hypothetical protein
MIVWVVLNKSAGGLYECLDVGLGYAQILSTIFTYDDMFAAKHSTHYNTIVQICNIVNLDVDFVSPSCMLPSGDWRWSYGFYILLAVPIIPFFVTGCGYLMALAWSKYVNDRDNRNADSREWKGIHLGFMCSTKNQVQSYTLSYLKDSIPFVGVVYNNVCLKSFAVFSCQQLRDGTSVMFVAPQVVCYETEHKQLMGVAIAALIIYVFGLPAFTLSTTMYAKTRDKLRDFQVLQTIGLFYKEYEPEYYWWDVVFLGRRFSLCLCAIVFHGMPYVQGGITILTITVAMLLQFICQPYWDKRVNALDCMCCLSITMHCIAVLYYNNMDFVNNKDKVSLEGGLVLDGLLVAADIICFALTGLLFAKTFTENTFRNMSCKFLTNNIVQTLLQLQQELVKERDTFDQLLHRNNVVMTPVSKSQSQSGESNAATVVEGTVTDANVVTNSIPFASSQAMVDEPRATPIPGEVTREGFIAAASQALGHQVGRPSLEALFFTLRLIQVDDDEHALEMSDVTREKLADKGEPIPIALVSPQACTSPTALSTRLSLQQRLQSVTENVLR